MVAHQIPKISGYAIAISYAEYKINTSRGSGTNLSSAATGLERKKNMDRKATAKQTLEILKNGYYLYQGSKIDISNLQDYAKENSVLITPQEGNTFIQKYGVQNNDIEDTPNSSVTHRKPRRLEDTTSCHYALENCSTVEGLLQMTQGGITNIGILNFASAKNPGGGFLNGAMAQEESLAASSGLYKTLTRHETYYRTNRTCGTMIYTDHAIYSPEVPFFRDGRFHLIPSPITASVLTLPAVNMGQVLLKGEDQSEARKAMYHRMKLALAIFASKGNRNLILGAYGCGVFRNDPLQIAQWWRILLEKEFPGCFDRILFAVLDTSRTQKCIGAFAQTFSTTL